ncbi:MAG: RNA polymerase sigma factor [Muribaculaceae bacterium]
MDDHAVVDALLLRNQKITQQYLYIKCYPLFKAVYNNYYTDCESCIEFINEIYVHLLTPDKETNLCKLQTFQFSSTLTTWIKTVAVYYCYERYRRKQKITFVSEENESDDFRSDRFDQYSASMYVEEPTMCMEDMEVLLNMMPNKRYSTIIRLRYVEGLSNEETAAALQMTMDNFYNKHLRAKKQFIEIVNKEKQYGKLL